MKYFFWTISVNTKEFISNAVAFPVWISIAIGIIYVLFIKLKYKKKFDRRMLTDKILPLSLMTFIYTMIAQLTILRRFTIHNTVDSFSEIWEGWLPFKQDFSFDLTSIQNIIMFIPLTLTVNWFILKFREKSLSAKKIIILSTAISFGMSLFIEISQAIFHIGMFQISDLTYNTLGGIIGAFLFNLITKNAQKQQ